MEPPESGAPGIFAMARPSRIEELVKGAGFESLDLREVGMSWGLDDFDNFWTYLNDIIGALATVIDELPEREKEEIRSDMKTALDPLGYDLPAACINVLAR
jgi:hypothetical protein